MIREIRRARKRGQYDPRGHYHPEDSDSPHVRPTPRISCEAVPPSVLPAGAQGGTSARSTGAALSFVSCIRLFGGLVDLLLRWLLENGFTLLP
jgi:hypothetical protein